MEDPAGQLPVTRSRTEHGRRVPQQEQKESAIVVLKDLLNAGRPGVVIIASPPMLGGAPSRIPADVGADFRPSTSGTMAPHRSHANDCIRSVDSLVAYGILVRTHFVIIGS